MDNLEVPYIFLQNKDLNLFDAVILAFIKSKMNEDYQFIHNDEFIASHLGITSQAIPNCLSKIYKLGLIEIHHAETRIITYTYDAPHSLSNSGYIYIMSDATHSYLKIGYSKDPSYRESTLQGEKPTIKLLGKWKGTMSQEQTCHRILAKYRIRGEWFNVDFEQASKVIKQVTGITQP